LVSPVRLSTGRPGGYRSQLLCRPRAGVLLTWAVHKRAMVALAEPPVTPDTLAALAFHADQAGDADAVLSYGLAAAQRAAALEAHSEAADLYGLVLRRADTAPAWQKMVWLEQQAFESYLCGQTQTSVASWREAIALRHELGDRLEDGDDLRWLSHLLWSPGRTTEATEAGLASLRLLEDLGPCPQLAWSLANLAQLARFGYDPPAPSTQPAPSRWAPNLGRRPCCSGPAATPRWPRCCAATPGGTSSRRPGGLRWLPTTAAKPPRCSGPASAGPPRCTTT
jgi:hypothetical protein